MPAVGLAVLFLGYSVTYYGVTQLRGGNWGLLDLVLPGRWTKARANRPPVDGTTVIEPSSSTAPSSSVPGSPTVSRTPSTGTALLPNALENPSPGLPMD